MTSPNNYKKGTNYNNININSSNFKNSSNDNISYKNLNNNNVNNNTISSSNNVLTFDRNIITNNCNFVKNTSLLNNNSNNINNSEKDGLYFMETKNYEINNMDEQNNYNNTFVDSNLNVNNDYPNSTSTTTNSSISSSYNNDYNNVSSCINTMNKNIASTNEDTHTNINVPGKKKGRPDTDTSLPIANINRIMKKILPASTKIAKESKDIMREYVTEFIQFLTSEACDICAKNERKIISGEDVLFALEKLGFSDYIAPLTEYLRKWKQVKIKNKLKC
ncbi:CCAAT-box DNA binding protein subunit B, putative [Hepatocystis sp. ex Piliocolobus tephrosceles]|nr:CCAAT-box DNA binding protein subunit B, putative [Hepatocystis sp. ex Piliocolobus tephrosceles]